MSASRGTMQSLISHIDPRYGYMTRSPSMRVFSVRCIINGTSIAAFCMFGTFVHLANNLARASSVWRPFTGCPSTVATHFRCISSYANKRIVLQKSKRMSVGSGVAVNVKVAAVLGSRTSRRKRRCSDWLVDEPRAHRCPSSQTKMSQCCSPSHWRFG